jgi:hypothetical protein
MIAPQEPINRTCGKAFISSDYNQGLWFYKSVDY